MKILSKGIIKRIHVNRQTIDRNRKQGTDVPVITVQHSKGPTHGKTVHIGCAKCGHLGITISQEAKQLSCGARVYIETTGEVIVE